MISVWGIISEMFRRFGAEEWDRIRDQFE